MSWRVVGQLARRRASQFESSARASNHGRGIAFPPAARDCQVSPKLSPQLQQQISHLAFPTLSPVLNPENAWFAREGRLTKVVSIQSWQQACVGMRGFASGAEGGESSQGTKALPETAGGAPRKVVRRGPVTWGSLLLLVLTGAGLLYYYDSEKRRRLEVVRQGPSVGKAAIGGPFSLVDHNGKPTTDQDLKGSWNVVYFGFTYCPDICPDELQKLAQAVDTVEKKSGLKIRPVFISIDPERDTVDQVKLYVQEFHPRLVGLTGSVDAIRMAAREYRVYFMKTEEEGDDYLVDHSIIMYLMDPNMDFVKFFGKNYNADALAEGIMEEVKNWSPKK